MIKAILMLAVLFFSGCTGTQIKVTPDPANMSSNYQQSRYETVGVSSLNSSSGQMSEGFSNTLKTSGFAKKSLYPLRADDKPDLTIETDFKVSSNENTGSNFTKSFFTGFTLFLLEPVFWYDFDYTVEASAIVTKAGNRVGRYEAKADATVSVKWLNLRDLKEQAPKALGEAQKSVYYQLMNQIR